MNAESKVLRFALSRSGHVKFFILEYYFGAGGVYIWIRTLGGPFLIFMGLNYLFSGERYSVYFGLFCVLFGLFYGLRPILTIIINKEGVFEDNIVTLSLEKSALHVQINTDEVGIRYQHIIEFSKRKWYYIIKASKNRSIFIPLNQMQADWEDALWEMRNMIED